MTKKQKRNQPKTAKKRRRVPKRIALVKRENGRPPVYDPGYAALAEKLCIKGYTDAELADFFEVSTRTVERWKGKHQEFSRALKVGKELADERVERALYLKAVGYSFPSEKVHFDKDGDVHRAPITEHVPPSDTAIIFWLKNRMGDKYRDVHKHEHTNTNIRVDADMSLAEAQEVYRQIRNMTAEEIDRHLRIIDGTTNQPASDAPQTVPEADAQESESASDESETEDTP